MKKAFIYTILFITMMLIGSGALNYTGFCWSEKRWLSSQEKINVAVSEVIRKRSVNVSEEASSSVLKYRVIRGVPYGSKEEFFSVNPNCCDLVGRAEDGFRPLLIEKLFGNFSCMVRVRFKFRYIDEAGVLRERFEEEFPVIKNCGIAWDGVE